MSIDFLYYSPLYLETQVYANLHITQNDFYQICFSIKDQLALSLSNSPMGSFYIKNQTNNDQIFKSFLQKVEKEVLQKKIRFLLVTHPPFFYQNFIPGNWLLKNGFTIKHQDLLHYIDLRQPLDEKVHLMEKRRLKKNESLIIRCIQHTDDLAHFYSFIEQCRMHKGLQINITKEKFFHLLNRLPKAYEAYGGYLDGQLICAALIAFPTPDIAYYYLAATHPSYLTKSPMVKMIFHLYGLFKKRGLLYFDLGVSSIEGVRQGSLATFKERMGAQTTEKITFIKHLPPSP